MGQSIDPPTKSNCESRNSGDRHNTHKDDKSNAFILAY